MTTVDACHNCSSPVCPHWLRHGIACHTCAFRHVGDSEARYCVTRERIEPVFSDRTLTRRNRSLVEALRSDDAWINGTTVPRC